MKNRSALHFVVIIGIANFFADFTYEGARGIIGPFLGSLGASAAEGTKNRCAATEDYALAKLRRAQDAKRTPGRERSRGS